MEKIGDKCAIIQMKKNPNILNLISIKVVYLMMGAYIHKLEIQLLPPIVEEAISTFFFQSAS